MRLAIDTFNLATVERTLCLEALSSAGTICDAAELLGITRHALKRRILKHQIEWPVRAKIAHIPGAMPVEVIHDPAAAA